MSTITKTCGTRNAAVIVTGALAVGVAVGTVLANLRSSSARSTALTDVRSSPASGSPIAASPSEPAQPSTPPLNEIPWRQLWPRRMTRIVFPAFAIVWVGALVGILAVFRDTWDWTFLGLGIAGLAAGLMWMPPTSRYTSMRELRQAKITREVLAERERRFLVGEVVGGGAVFFGAYIAFLAHMVELYI